MPYTSLCHLRPTSTIHLHPFTTIRCIFERLFFHVSFYMITSLLFCDKCSYHVLRVFWFFQVRKETNKRTLAPRKHGESCRDDFGGSAGRFQGRVRLNLSNLRKPWCTLGCVTVCLFGGQLRLLPASIPPCSTSASHQNIMACHTHTKA